ncbi:MAG: MFS transporter [Cyanophyceae cyanobacterium]
MKRLQNWLPQLQSQVWLLAAGRLLSQVGTGFIFFYAPIFFVNQVGISATLVGIGIGSASVSGVVGRFLGGAFADSQFWGRRRTLLLSAAVSAIADVVLALTTNFATLVVGNLLMGLGQGLYWPATEAAVADLTTPEDRNEAFAMTRLADSLGLGVGVVLGGALISASGNYRVLFVIDGISFVLFFGLIYRAITETYQSQEHQQRPQQTWLTALQDRRFLLYLVVNILFTTNIAQVQSTLPLYLKNHVSEPGFSATAISALFTWHIAFAALCQIPVARFLKRFGRPRALSLSLLLWSGGFVLIWGAGVALDPLLWAIAALGVLAIAMVAYTPIASALVVELAPPALRGVYFSLSSQCWAAGFFIGPAIGGWAMDQTTVITDRFWLATAASSTVGILLLQYLERLLPTDSSAEN